jgi:hypothetical protein
MQSFLPTGEGLASKPEVILHSPHGDGVGIGRRSWDVVGDGPEGKQQQSSKAARPLSARGGSTWRNAPLLKNTVNGRTVAAWRVLARSWPVAAPFILDFSPISKFTMPSSVVHQHLLTSLP